VANPVVRDGQTSICRYRWRPPSGLDGPRELEIQISLTAAGHAPIVRTHVVALWPHTTDQLSMWLKAAGFAQVRVEIDADDDRHTVIARAG
jgi:hypothetical protein